MMFYDLKNGMFHDVSWICHRDIVMFEFVFVVVAVVVVVVAVVWRSTYTFTLSPRSGVINISFGLPFSGFLRYILYATELH